MCRKKLVTQVCPSFYILSKMITNYGYVFWLCFHTLSGDRASKDRWSRPEGWVDPAKARRCENVLLSSIRRFIYGCSKITFSTSRFHQGLIVYYSPQEVKYIMLKITDKWMPEAKPVTYGILYYTYRKIWVCWKKLRLAAKICKILAVTLKFSCGKFFPAYHKHLTNSRRKPK